MFEDTSRRLRLLPLHTTTLILLRCLYFVILNTCENSRFDLVTQLCRRQAVSCPWAQVSHRPSQSTFPTFFGILNHQQNITPLCFLTILENLLISQNMEFTHFPKLPAEIRLKIWGFCLPPDTGIVDVVAVQTAEVYRYSTMDDLCHRRMGSVLKHARDQDQNEPIMTFTVYHESVYAASALHHWFRLSHVCTEMRSLIKKNFLFAVNSMSEIPGEIDKEFDKTRRSDSKGDSIWVPSPSSTQDVESGTNTFANALHLTITPEISPEAETLKLYYQLASGSNSLWNRFPSMQRYILDGEHASMRFNPKTDVIFLANPRDSAMRQHTARLSTLLRWSGTDALFSVEMFAMSYSSWRKEICAIPLMLIQLRSLKRFWVCFVEADEEELDKVEGGWLSGVSGKAYGEDTRNTYFEQAEKEIMANIPALAGLYDACALDCQMPIVEVVRDRRELRRALDLLAKQ